MDKNKRLLEFPLMDEFAVNLKMRLEMPDPFNQFKLLFPQKRAAELHQATLTNLNALVEPDVYVPIGLSLNMARLNLVSERAKPNFEDLTPEEEDLLEMPRSRKPAETQRREPNRTPQPHPQSNQTSYAISSGGNSHEPGAPPKRCFEAFSDFMDGLDEFFRRPQDVLDSLQIKLKEIFTHNTSKHHRVALKEIARRVPESQVRSSLSVTLPSADYFPSEKVIQSTVNLLSKTATIEAPDLSVITVGEDNHKVLSFYRRNGPQEVYEKTREFGIYVPSEGQRRATGSACNLFVQTRAGACAVIPIDFSVDIRKENRGFAREVKTIDADQNMVSVDEDALPEAPVAVQPEEPMGEGELSDAERQAMDLEARSATSEDSLNRMVLE